MCVPNEWVLKIITRDIKISIVFFMLLMERYRLQVPLDSGHS